MRQIASVVLLFLCCARPASGVCNTPQPRLVCAEYFKAELVVIARLASIRHVVPRNDVDGYLYGLTSQKVLRGNVAPSFRVYEENSSGRASFDWGRGRSYLLFLSFSKLDGAWVLDGCGNSQPLSQAGAVLKEIEALKEHRDGGFLQDAVESHVPPFAISGVGVRIRGNGRVYRTVTDKNGRFEVHLPPGTYVVEPNPRQGYTFEPHELTYEDPHKIKIKNGSCAQVGLVSTPKKKTRNSK